jgi:hypothetical protein
MPDEYFWSIIKEFNFLMKSSIVGPNCIDPNICKGDCCSIKIDVPKVLAKEYVKKGYAKKEDFGRSDIFSFQLRFDNKMGKCFLFDKLINGCKVHNSDIKPPQCWIYPTNFSHPDKKIIACKKVSGWRILDQKKTLTAENLLKKYNFLCQIEAKKELKNINKRIGNVNFMDQLKIKKNVDRLKNKIKKIAPSNLGGFKDEWDFVDILPAEGFSLQMKRFCSKYNNKCKFISDQFLECRNICDIIINELIKFLQNNLYKYIKVNGPDSEGEYSLIKLFDFEKNR